MNILFVERDPASRRLLKDMLVGAGASLTEIDGAAGLRMLAGERPDLAVVEVEPAGEGMAAIVRLRARGPDRTQILALAADASLAEACRIAGADEVLVEPAAMTALFDAVARCLPPG